MLKYYHSSVPKTADNELDQKTVIWSEGVTFLAIVGGAKKFLQQYVPVLCEKQKWFEVC